MKSNINLNIESIDDVNVLIQELLKDTSSRSQIEDVFLNGNELNCIYLEELGKKCDESSFIIIRDLLCRRKAKISFNAFEGSLRSGVYETLEYLRDEYIEDVREEYSRLIFPRLDEIDIMTNDVLDIYCDKIEFELLNSPTIDVYQFVVDFIDTVFKKLPVNKFPEYDSCPEEEFEDYKKVVEMMYIQLAGKLLHFTISSFNESVNVKNNS